MKTMLKFLSLTTALSAFVPLAMATPLVPGATGTPVGITTSAGATGTLVASTGNVVFNAITFNGVFSETVYANASGNTLAGCGPTSGCLDYVFTISNDPKYSGSITTLPSNKSKDAILVSTMADYLGYSVTADYIAGTGAAPLTASLNTFGTVNYSFSTTGIAPGKASDTLVLYTNATVNSGGLFGVADGSNVTMIDDGPGTAPTTSLSGVPEPSSLFLLGTGLTATVGMARRRFKA